MFDKDNSGFISIEEIKELFGYSAKSADKVSDAVWKEIMKDVDENSDG